MRRALLTTIHSDSHSWNLVFMELFLREQGFMVENLGVSVPPDLVLETAARFRPDLIVVSTVNGHGYLEGVSLGRGLIQSGAARHLVIGGKLSTDPAWDKLHRDQLLNAGFDAVFTQDSDLNDFRRYLRGVALRSLKKAE